MSEVGPFRIGYALALKKQRSFLQDKLLAEASRRGIDLVPIDVSRPIDQQGHFDAILQKIATPDWYKNLEEFREKHPDVIILDPPEAIQRLHNRISMLQAVPQRKTYESGSTIGIPKQVVVQDKESLSAAFTNSGLKFPVIAKPLVADGTAVSHLMLLVYNKRGLAKVSAPCLLQEFVNHGGVIFKMYVVGEHVKCVRRKSLPDVCDADLEDVIGLKSFSKISNTTASPSGNGAIIDASLASVELPPSGLMLDISARLRRELGLQLFNCDLIRRTGSDNRFFIVDINYFPGFAKMPDFEVTLTNFFAGLAMDKANRP